MGSNVVVSVIGSPASIWRPVGALISRRRLGLFDVLSFRSISPGPINKSRPIVELPTTRTFISTTISIVRAQYDNCGVVDQTGHHMSPPRSSGPGAVSDPDIPKPLALSCCSVPPRGHHDVGPIVGKLCEQPGIRWSTCYPRCGPHDMGSVTVIQFRVLGNVEARVEGVAVNVGHPRRRGVLAVLPVHADHIVSTDQLLDRAWGDHPPERGRDTLHSYVSRLRR